jgi:hypothetical protein
MPQNHSTQQEERPLEAQGVSVNQSWLRMLDAYHVRFLVLNLHSEGDVVKLFRSQPGWSVDFEDGESIIFARAEATDPHSVTTQLHNDVPISA